MNSATSQPTIWIVVAITAIAAAVLAHAEWRRPDGRRLAGRLLASIAAVLALALFAVRPLYYPRPTTGNPATATAVLWTASQEPITPSPGVAPADNFALPAASPPPGAGVAMVPDVAGWRRRFPYFEQVRILGDGFESAELPALDGLHVDFDPPRAGPGLLLLHCPRSLPLGAPLRIEGRVKGLAAGGVATVTLNGPDGRSTDAATAPADTAGEAVFTAHCPAVAAAGAYTWHLRIRVGEGPSALVLADETIGVEVRAARLPRVLVLESAPRFDTARVRRWYELAGGTLRERLRVGQDRYRYFAADGSAAPEFNALDAALLAGFDLVLADGRALLSLPAAERTLVHAAMVETGLGVVLLADEALLPPATVAPDRAWIFPWHLRATDAAADASQGTERLARLLWPGSGDRGNSSAPIPVAPFEIELSAGQSALVRDDQGRVFAGSAPLGRGTLTLTLARETGRWERADDPAAFADYWSWLFARTARPLDESTLPTLVGGDDRPVFVDRPLEITWTAAEPKPATVRDESSAALVSLAPAQDPAEPTRWQATFWPRHPGWHRVEAGVGTLDFYVHAADAFPALAAWQRRVATAQYAARSANISPPPRSTNPVPIPGAWWFGMFLTAAGFLWIERRFARV